MQPCQRARIALHRFFEQKHDGYMAGLYPAGVSTRQAPQHHDLHHLHHGFGGALQQASLMKEVVMPQEPVEEHQLDRSGKGFARQSRGS